MDGENQQLQPVPVKPPQPHMNPGSIYPEATRGIHGPHTPPSASPTPATQAAPPPPPKSARSLRSLWRVMAIVLTAGVMFFAGYQLAIYQTTNNDTWFPHFSFNNSITHACPTGDTPEYGPSANAALSDETPICLRPGEEPVALKPVIYLYPTHPEQIDVKLSYPVGFSQTVPGYNPQTGWQVMAQPDGTLTNLADGKTYPYLFWEGKPAPLRFDMTKGFVVAGDQTKPFLQSQLTAMGLSQDETSAFIAFWLPRMQGSPYNLIHFAGSEYTNYAKLTITPKPDSLLRVFMAFEPLQAPVKASPQAFPVFHRNGFTAIEWGGTELH